ncbi:hypothetical protein BJY52DRAFT_1245687 [Lactarius psammicola]|nr:hypothetical protein BJY52DRAFT_1245687 [Lactarius psammicola]
MMHNRELQTHRRKCSLLPLTTANNPHTTRSQYDRIFNIAGAALDSIIVPIAIFALYARYPHAVSAQMGILHLVCSPLWACLDRRVALISGCWLSLHLLALYHSRMPTLLAALRTTLVSVAGYGMVGAPFSDHNMNPGFI